MTVKAVFETGIFRPTQPADLPENCCVEFDVRIVSPPDDETGLEEVYAILSKRFDSGDSNVAQRHDEHQP